MKTGQKMKNNFRKNMTRSAVCLVLAAPLMACGGSDKGGPIDMGYSKNVPNEFNVVRRPPLILPPQFNLIPPASTSARPATPTGAELARLIVLPNAPQEPMSKLEQSLVDKAARGQAFGNGVREQLGNTANGTVSEEASTVETLTQDQAQ